MSSPQRKPSFFRLTSSEMLAKSPCPGCHMGLDAVTAALADDFGLGMPKLKGHVTMCAYCGALLIFSDDEGHLRIMTEEERNSLQFSEIVARFYAQWRAENNRNAERFTRRSGN